MFGKSQQNQGAQRPQKKSITTGRDAAVTILTSGCHFSGKLYCRGSSRIGGKIEGQIISEGILIIEEGATILAEVKADEVIIQGKVNGRLEAKIRVELYPQSRFDGDIVTPVLVVNEGAQFNGRSIMSHGASASSHQTTDGRKSRVLPMAAGSSGGDGSAAPEIKVN
ncbi:MAG: polymer-forming cytoskeletal protein [Proteobacteria bacterium]|nr:polymer-forming cytoskeletal protein [Pseudomonadota bacterium]